MSISPHKYHIDDPEIVTNVKGDGTYSYRCAKRVCVLKMTYTFKCNGLLEPHESRLQQLPLAGEYEGDLAGAINKYHHLSVAQSQHPMDIWRIKLYLKTKT